MKSTVNQPFFVISAPSGAGKNSLIALLLEKEDRLNHSISCTTRKKRNYETEGLNYYYLTKGEFEKKIGEDEFLEYAKVLDNYYGTSRTEIDRIFALGKFPILDIDIQGMLNLRTKTLHFVSIFIMPPSVEELRRRLVLRGSESEEEINKRLELAETEMQYASQFDHSVVNYDLNQARDEMLTIIRSYL